MKKILLIGAILFLAIAATAATPDFYAGANRVVVAQDPIPPDDLATALNAHGMDMTVAAQAASLMELALAGGTIQAMTLSGAVKDIADLKAAVTSLQGATALQGAPGPAGPQGIPGPAGADGASGAIGPVGLPGKDAMSIPDFTVAQGYTINRQAMEASCSKAVLGRNSSLVQFQQADLPFFCDFLVWAPADGNYAVIQRVAIASGAGTVTAHYELPIGTNVANWKYNNVSATGLPNTGPMFPPTSNPIALKQGWQVLRLVIDSSVDGWEQLNWIELVKQ